MPTAWLLVNSLAAEMQSPPLSPPAGFAYRIVGAAAFAHLLNDLIQALRPSIDPMLKTDFSLSFAQIGWIAPAYQITASLLQPWIGLYTDKHPQPYLLPAGMVVTLLGIGLPTSAGSYLPLLGLATAFLPRKGAARP